MEDLRHTLIPALFGAIFQELLYWYDLRSKLGSGEYDEMLRSYAYWMLTLMMICGSAYGTTIWFASESVGPKDYMIVSAAFPLLFKHAVSAIGQRPTLGSRNVVKSYFRIG